MMAPHPYDTVLPVNGDSLTISSVKRLDLETVRGMVRIALKKAGLRGCDAVMATDGDGNGRGWHIGFYEKCFTDAEKLVITMSLDGLRVKMDLGSKDYFVRWGIHNASRYIRNHDFVEECVTIR
jgi:hypothetical protein